MLLRTDDNQFPVEVDKINAVRQRFCAAYKSDKRKKLLILKSSFHNCGL